MAKKQSRNNLNNKQKKSRNNDSDRDEDEAYKQIKIGQWTLYITYVDNLLTLHCSSLEEKYELKGSYNKPPQGLSLICKTLPQFRQLASNGQYAVKEGKLFMKIQFGAFSKQFDLQLCQQNLKIQAYAQNLQMLLKRERQKIRQLSIRLGLQNDQQQDDAQQENQQQDEDQQQLDEQQSQQEQPRKNTVNPNYMNKQPKLSISHNNQFKPMIKFNRR